MDRLAEGVVYLSMPNVHITDWRPTLALRRLYPSVNALQQAGSDRLQQKWVDHHSGDVQWRDVPMAFES